MGAGPAIIAKGAPAYTHLPHSRPWYRNTHRLITSYTYGYGVHAKRGTDGLQSLMQWNQAFDYSIGIYWCMLIGTCSSASKLGLLNAIQTIGALSAYTFAPYMADGMGRRFPIIFGASLMTAGIVVQTDSHSVDMFIGARFLIGFGQTFAAAAAPLLVVELAYPSHRSRLTSLYITLRCFIHDINLVDLVRPRVTTLARRSVPSKFLLTIMRMATHKILLYSTEFEEIIALDWDVAGGVGWLSLMNTLGNRKHLNNAVGIMNQTTQLLFNGVLNTYNFIVAVIAAFYCDHCMVVFWTAQTIRFSIHQETVVAFICFEPQSFTKHFVAFSPLLVSYTFEIPPFALPAKGFITFSFVLSLSLIFNQCDPSSFLQWKYYVSFFLICIFWLCFAFVFCYFFIIETNNVRITFMHDPRLKETAAIFDGEEGMIHIHDKAATHAAVSRTA
ncbi:hypothetical protein EDB19DRAFT_1828861 [Suillus lakei]|nr:hypothetical protein EDB19DRAFT_1828861 [Suillus lakei]